MKKLIAIILVGLLLTCTAFAAEWTEGRSPSKPYLGQPEADFTKTIGYMMRFPNQKLGMEGYCDHLTVYMPREDLAIGMGNVRVYEKGVRNPIHTVDFRDGQSIVLRPMTETELDALLWGSGMAYEIFLPQSLQIGKEYYAAMDAGCLATADWQMTNAEIKGAEAWPFAVSGEFGVQGLYYASYDAETETLGETHIKPAEGDRATFELVLGGNAKTALFYCADGSVAFESPMLTESGTYFVDVLSDSVNWGIVFLAEDGTTAGYIDLTR